MNTQEFLVLLQEQPERALYFEYRPKQFIPTAYHITEIKKVRTESVDCGGRPHQYDETVVQLWWDGKEQSDQPMSAAKAHKIFSIVDATNSLLPETEIFFEYGFEDLPTSIYRVKAINKSKAKLVLQLEVPAPQCKPKQDWENASQCCGENTACC